MDDLTKDIAWKLHQEWREVLSGAVLADQPISGLDITRRDLKEAADEIEALQDYKRAYRLIHNEALEKAAKAVEAEKVKSVEDASDQGYNAAIVDALYAIHELKEEDDG